MRQNLSRARCLATERSRRKQKKQHHKQLWIENKNKKTRMKTSTRGNYLFTHLNCQTSYAETDTRMSTFCTPFWFLLLDYCPESGSVSRQKPWLIWFFREKTVIWFFLTTQKFSHTNIHSYSQSELTYPTNYKENTLQNILCNKF